MDTIEALQIVPAFKRLHEKGRNRTQAEEKEYQEMLAKNPILKKIPLLEQYTELVEMSGRSDVQEAELENFKMRYPDIVALYARRRLMKPSRGKGRSRRRTQKRKATRRTRRR